MPNTAGRNEKDDAWPTILADLFDLTLIVVLKFFLNLSFTS